MKYIISLLLGFFLCYASYTAYDAYKFSKKENEYKYDFAEIHMIKYGMFNLELWKEKLFDVLKDRMNDFEITEKDLDVIRKQIEIYLEDLYEEYFDSGKLLDALVESRAGDDKENKLGRMFVGLFRKNIEAELKRIDFKSEIPLIADNLMVEVERKVPEIKESISKSITDILAEELKASLADQRLPIYQKYGFEEFESTELAIANGTAEAIKEKESLLKRSLSALVLSLLLLLIFYRLFDLKTSMTWLTVICTIFLMMGLALPMIDLDARLSTLDVQVLGKDIHFDEQVMYFQSKSIVDVTRTLLEGRGLDLKIVGILILVFSIVLPFSKMILSTAYLYIPKTRNSKIVETIIFYMGKWSMADVFVVAIFMSYIGFYGLINSMIGDFSSQGYSTTAETVNYSKLSPGIIFFTAYCILSIIMSSLIQRKFKST